MKFTGERFVECEETAGKQIELEHWQRYMMAAYLLKPEYVVLDIACGTGYGAKYLSQFAEKIYGVDISAEAIEYANEYYSGDNICFMQGNVIDIPLPDKSVDCIVSFETIEHVDEDTQRIFLAETKRILKPDGILIISCPNKPIASDLAYELWGSVNEFHKKEYNETEFKALLLDYYDGVSMLYQRNENALIMDSPGADILKVQWGYRKKRTDTQNLIAICGTEAIDPTEFACIIPDIHNHSIENLRQLAKYVNTVNKQQVDIEHLIRLKDSAEEKFQKEFACLYDLKISYEKIIQEKDCQIAGNVDYIGELQKTISEQDKNQKDLVDVIQQLQEVVSQKDKDLCVNSDYIVQLQEAISQKDKDLLGSSNYIVQLQEVISQKDKDLCVNSDYIVQLQEAISQKDNDLLGNANYISQLQNVVTQNNIDLNNNISYIVEMQTVISENLKIIEYKQKCLSETLDELSKCKQRNDECHHTIYEQSIRIAELETIEQSTLWKCTKPIRKLLDVLKRYMFRS